MTKLLPILALVACNGGGGPGGGGPGGGGGGNADPDVVVPARDADRTFTGDLADGQTMELGWASSNYCWPGNENVNFDGAHVVTTFTQPRGVDVTVRVDPDPGVDVSIYAIQSTGDAQIPPDVASPWGCEAMYDASNDNNPGQAEILFLQNYLDFEVTLGVAGANGAVSGGYTVQIWEDDGAEFDTAAWPAD